MTLDNKSFSIFYMFILNFVFSDQKLMASVHKFPDFTQVSKIIDLSKVTCSVLQCSVHVALPGETEKRVMGRCLNAGDSCVCPTTHHTACPHPSH